MNKPSRCWFEHSSEKLPHASTARSSFTGRVQAGMTSQCIQLKVTGLGYVSCDVLHSICLIKQEKESHTKIKSMNHNLIWPINISLHYRFFKWSVISCLVCPTRKGSSNTWFILTALTQNYWERRADTVYSLSTKNNISVNKMASLGTKYGIFCLENLHL